MTGSWIYQTQGFSSIHHSKRPVKENDRENEDGTKMCPWYKADHLLHRWPFLQVTLFISFFIFMIVWNHWHCCPLKHGALLGWYLPVVTQVFEWENRWWLHPFMNHHINCGVLQSSFRIADTFAINSFVECRQTLSTSIQNSELNQPYL